jgi:hypothetical protein
MASWHQASDGLLREDRARRRDHDRLDRFPPLLVRDTDDRHLPDVRMPDDDFLDLAWVD